MNPIKSPEKPNPEYRKIKARAYVSPDRAIIKIPDAPYSKVESDEFVNLCDMR